MAKRPRKAKLLADQYPTHYLPNVGRQVMQEGGVPEAEGDVSFAPPEVEARQAYDVSPVIDQNVVRTAREALERNRDRPFENASDFVRHQLNKDEPQLPQYDREGVKAWQEGAKELAHIGAYGIPVVGEGLAAYDLANAARDVMSPEFREAVKNRNYLSSGATLGSLGLAAFGAPGRLAKAAAAAGAVMMPQEAQSGVVDRALKAIRAYHGSPHKFDKFDINKIGTGEGVQAYGHGLYFSGNEDVARSYAENAEDKYAPGIIARRMLAGWPDRDTAIQKQMERIARLEQSHNEDFIAPYRGALDLLKSGEIPKAGHMYEVDIHANPEHLLDWHKRLHEQSPHVQSNLKDMAQDAGMPMRYWKPVNPEDAATGEEYYSSLAQKFKSKTNPVWDPKKASSELKSWALPGIQYIDPAARGDGSRNYVMFDPNLVDITRRYAKGGDVEGYDKGGAIAKVLGKLMAPGSGYAPRKGFPELVNLPGIGKVESRPIPEIESIARRFAGEAHDADVTPLNPEFSKRVAQEYDVMRHDPQDPIVKRAFQALADETMQQYRAAKDLGLDIKFLKPGQADPYAASPALGYEDIVNRGRLFVYPTEAGFGSTGGINASNVLLKGAGRIGDKEDAVVNDAFRVIHDLYGHFGPGNPFFRAPGEERAFQLHKRMFSPEARPALTSETRGQNSWVNFGDMAERNRAAKGADTYYADQKTGLMPEWTMEEPPAEGVDVEKYIRSLPHKDKGGLVSKAMQIIRAYHGSPHKFDAFDLNRSHTGSGMQLLGHGAYLTESPEYAREF